MVREAKGKFKKESNSNAGRIRVPAKLCLDSSFPFKDGQEVSIRIYTPPKSAPMGKSLIVEAIP